MAKKPDSIEDIGLSGSRLKKLTIRNFRCIGKEGVSIELDRIVVLVGSNNVGKSTILRAYQHVMDHKNISIDDLPKGKFDQENPPTVELETWLGDEVPGEDWWIKEDAGNYIRERWVWGEDFKPVRQGWSSSTTEGWSTKVPWGAPNIAKAQRPKPHRVEAFASPQDQAALVAKLLVEWIKEGASNFAPTENTEDASAFGKIKKIYKEVHEELVKETQERVTQAEDAITSLVSSVFDGYKVKFDVFPNESADKIIDALLTNPTIRMGPDGGHLANVQDQGSGAQRTLLWAALKLLAEEGKESKGAKKTTKTAKATEPADTEKTEPEKKRPNVLLIDEPEICLHPSAVREACRTLYDLAEGESNWQVMVTTHSPVFIDISRDHTTVVRVQKNEHGIISGTTVFRPDRAELTDDDQEHLKLLNLWDPYVAEFFFGGRTILVEGDTEYTAFRSLMDEKPAEFKNVHVIRARGKAILLPLIKILNHFGQPYSVLHDADMPTITTKNGSQTNGMWTENEKIRQATLKSETNVRLVASIKDFETAVFGEESKKNKPYSSWIRLKESEVHKKTVSDLLAALIDHSKPLPDGFLAWNDLDTLKVAVEELPAT